VTAILIATPTFNRADEAGPAASADTCYLFTSFTKNGDPAFAGDYGGPVAPGRGVTPRGRTAMLPLPVGR
jgi:hypothetical protein